MSVLRCVPLAPVVGWVVGLLASALGGGCLGPDPNHCAHQEGDRSCGGQTPYCNDCLASTDNGGCVAEQPERKCYAPGDEPYVDVAESGGQIGSECEAFGTIDDVCPEELAYCIDGVCSACDAGGASFCEGLDSSRPVCGELGSCVECSDEITARCSGETPFCNAGTCSGCFEHSQCGDYGCNLFSGECMQDGDVVWVAGPECDSETGAGTKSDPYCDLGSVQQRLQGEGNVLTIHLQGPDVFSSSIGTQDDTVALIGDHERPSIRIGGNALSTTGGLLLVEGLSVESMVTDTVSCEQGRLWLRNAEITDNATGLGLELDGCEHAVVERSIVAHNAAGGIRASESNVVLLSTAVLANGTPDESSHGITVAGGTLTASHITLVANFGDAGGRNLECDFDNPGDLSNVSIRNAVILDLDAASFSECEGISLLYSAVDDVAFVDEGAGVVGIPYDDAYFEEPRSSDPHLSSDNPFADVARWMPGDPRVDIDGESLNAEPGATNFAGCDQR